MAATWRPVRGLRFEAGKTQSQLLSGSLLEATVGAFTSQKAANATDQGSFPSQEPLPAHILGIMICVRGSAKLS